MDEVPVGTTAFTDQSRCLVGYVWLCRRRLQWPSAAAPQVGEASFIESDKVVRTVRIFEVNFEAGTWRA